MSDIKIPENAIELIDKTLKEAKSTGEVCGKCLDGFASASGNCIEDCYHRSKLLINHFKMFPFIWAGFDYKKWNVFLQSYLGACFLCFETKEKQETVNIPYGLFIFLNAKLPKIPEENSFHESFVEEVLELCVHTENTLKIVRTSIIEEKTIITNGEISAKEDSNYESSVEPPKGDSEIIIPENAFELIEDVSIKAKELKSKCDSFTTDNNQGQKNGVNIEECIQGGQTFIKFSELLPYRWAGVSRIKYNAVLPEKSSQVYYFEFWSTDNRYEYKHRIPDQLYCLFSDLLDLDHVAISNQPEYIVYLSKICAIFIKRLEFLKQELSTNKNDPASGSKGIKVTPLSNQLGIVIPSDAIELIEQIMYSAQNIKRACIDELTKIAMHKSLTQTEYGNYNHGINLVDSFCRLIELFPLRWCKYDPVIWRFYPRAKGDRYYFCFFQPEVIPGFPPGEPLVEIPQELFKAYDKIQLPVSSSEDNPLKYVKEGIDLCEVAFFLFRDLEEFLIFREECISKSRTKLDEYKKDKDSKLIDEPELIGNGLIVRCKKGEFKFTPFQAPVIKVYFDNYNSGNEYLLEQDALEKADELCERGNTKGTSRYSQTSFISLFKSRRKEFDAIFERYPEVKDLFRLNLE